MKRLESHDRGIPTEKLKGIPTGELVERLSLGIFSEQNRKKYWIDPKTGYNCFTLFARELLIYWSNDERYWKWKWDSLQESSNVHVEVAELLNVCWFEVKGKLHTSNLSPGVMYEVVFVMKLEDSASGWGDHPVCLNLTLPDRKKQQREEKFISKPKSEWLEVPIGEFWTCRNMDGDMHFSLDETGSQWKSGLVIKGVTIRPKSILNHNHFTVISKDLDITWGNDKRYWCWYCLNITSNIQVDVAELLDVCWLNVNGKFNISNLTPGITYEVAFVVMLKDDASGFWAPVNLKLEVPDREKQEHQECIQHKPKEEWLDLKVGEFTKCSPENRGEIKFSLWEFGGHWKGGLVIKRVVIRPKN